MAYQVLTKKPFDYTNSWLCEKDKIHQEQYECYSYEYEQFCVETNKIMEDSRVLDWSLRQENDLTHKYAFQIKGVSKYTYFKVVEAKRHPNHWE